MVCVCGACVCGVSTDVLPKLASHPRSMDEDVLVLTCPRLWGLLPTPLSSLYLMPGSALLGHTALSGLILHSRLKVVYSVAPLEGDEATALSFPGCRLPWSLPDRSREQGRLSFASP